MWNILLKFIFFSTWLMIVGLTNLLKFHIILINFPTTNISGHLCGNSGRDRNMYFRLRLKTRK